MNDEKMALVVPELGYALKRLPECYLLMRWDKGGVTTKGKTIGQERKPGWVSMEKYPGSLEWGIRMITERAMADALANDDATTALRKLKEIVGVIGGLGVGE